MGLGGISVQGSQSAPIHVEDNDDEDIVGGFSRRLARSWMT
jgi:hypothetical protein